MTEDYTEKFEQEVKSMAAGYSQERLDKILDSLKKRKHESQNPAVIFHTMQLTTIVKSLQNVRIVFGWDKEIIE
jgi:hypothetical protein